MAHFSLYLLNLKLAGATPTFIYQPISIFSNTANQYHSNGGFHLVQNPTFCYSYNENFQMHQNNQKTLTFSMDRRITREDRIEENPFIYHLFVGAQLLLVDKYDKHHLMTISKISFTFNEFNTIYNFECQDSFTHQLSRQNNGYEIVNDPASEDYIGAKEVDWWALKIDEECSISYRYIKLRETSSSLEKLAYNKSLYADLYQKIPFAASGTADSVLIALGDLMGLQLKTYERFNFESGELTKEYWFEPKKSLRPSGLTYSPYSSIQSFSMDHLGTSLSTVFNVATHSIGDEMISLIPSVPNFFKRWFTTADWNNSSYAPGIFAAKCHEEVLYITGKTTTTTDTELSINITLNNLYDSIRFFDSAGNSSSAITDSTVFNSSSNNWKYKIQAEAISTEELYPEDSIPVEVFSWSNPKLIIIIPGLLANQDISYDLVVSQYRDASQEEIEFAFIADQCPWLENRLIDFRYFYDHTIITPKQFGELQSILYNDLRKANAKLLLYASEYYNAWAKKTEAITNLTTKIDTTHAIFNSDIIGGYNNNGSHIKIQDFSISLSSLTKTDNSSVGIIDYYNTLADYLNKYVNAEQVFLKNIYQFKKYFEVKTNLPSYYKYTLSLNSSDSNIKYSFTQGDEYTIIGDENSIVEGDLLFSLQDSQYLPINFKEDIVTIDNVSEFYEQESFEESLIQIQEEDECYDKNQKYYKQEDDQYQEVSWLEIKTNYFEKLTADPDWHIHTQDYWVAISSIPSTWDTLFLQNSLLDSTPEKQDGTEESNDKIYLNNLPLTEIYYGSKKTPTSFVNYSNALTFYRRISTTVEKQNFWKVSSGLLNGFSLEGTIAGGINLWIANMVWKYGNYDFGTEGVCYQDIFGNTVSSFTRYTTITDKICYIKDKNSFKQMEAENDDNFVLEINEENLEKYTQYLGLTYYTANSYSTDSHYYYYKPKYWRKVETLVRGEKYKVLIRTRTESSSPDKTSYPFVTDDFTDNVYVNVENPSVQRLDSIKYYPLGYVLFDLSTDDIHWNGKDTYDVKNLAWGNKYSVDILHVEDYDYCTFTDFNSSLTGADVVKTLSNQIWYDNTTLLPIDLTKQANIVTGYYRVGTEKYKQATEFNSKTLYYKKNDDGTYSRAYTKEQWIKKGIYYKEVQSHDFYSFDGDLEKIEYPTYKFEKVGDSWKYIGKENYVFEKLKPVKSVNLNTMSNGDFWANYYESEISLLREHAMLIEATLTEYWTNAYYASKNCRFFLPEFWQPSIDQTTNNFASQILHIIKDDDKQVKTSLQNTYIPTVKTSAGNFQYQYKKYDGSAISKEVVNQLSLDVQDSAQDICDNNPAIKNIFTYLGLEVTDWSGIRIDNNHTYYEYVSGGFTWNEALDVFSGGALKQYAGQFGGWYDMMIFALKNGNFKDYIPEQYMLAQEEHNKIWKGLYNQYPNLILEQSYTNENAVSSTELLKMAQLAFKDYSQVEVNYNISVLDPYSLRGYEGQELKIGDAIELMAEEIYPDLNSDIYKGLQQFLYISDISYELRSDVNIQITVNNIKYGEKVIGQLIKLIR